MIAHTWSELNHLQIGKYAEYFVKMKFVLGGFDVYSAEVDDRGIDFVVRKNSNVYYDIQVKSVRNLNNIFFAKENFDLRDNLLASVVIFREDEPPHLFLLRSTLWQHPNPLFASRDYMGLKSRPEWGLNLSRGNWPILAEHDFDKVVQTL